MSVNEGLNSLALARLNKNGTLDSGFGDGGKLLLSGLDINATWFEVTDVEITSKGKIVAAFTTGNSSFAITFNSNGSISNGYLLGTEVADHFVGTSSGDILFGLAGNDELYGGNGNDTLYGGEGDDLLDGGEGFDLVNYADSDSDLNINLQLGTASGEDIGNDRLNLIESIAAGSGDDIFVGGSGDFTINGGNGFNTIDYTFSESNLVINLQKGSAAGQDIGKDKLIKIQKVIAGSGNDLMYGSSKSDELQGGGGDDNVYAGAGNDLIVGSDGAGNDYYNGGSGVDTIRYTSALDNITVNLTTGFAQSSAGDDSAGIGRDQLVSIENVIAGDFNDVLIGNKIANRLEGGDGNDSLNGMLGKDTLIGGFGNDEFIFNTKLGSANIDNIVDFEAGIDKIVLDDVIFKKLAGVSDLTNHFVIGPRALDADDYLIYNDANGMLYYDLNGSGRGGLTAFAQLGIGLEITAQDFYVI